MISSRSIHWDYTAKRIKYFENPS